MNIEWFGRYPDPAAKRKQIDGIHPLKRIGKAEEVGALCAFLCTPLAGFITGTTILIDGGRSALLQDV
jgi:NAD(P)-dependent dehydrogenase (short-subunit alcohol dehydrogenase family)